MINRKAYDDLCDKLEPYVTQAISLSTEKELADLAAEDKKNKAALNKLLEEEEPDEVTRKSLEYDLLFSLDYTLNSEILRIVRVKVATEVLAVSWSESLRWMYKERGETKLRDCLLPEGFENSVM